MSETWGLIRRPGGPTPLRERMLLNRQRVRRLQLRIPDSPQLSHPEWLLHLTG
ncbi:MAG: hypothetical protein ABGZ53_27490 [Fuerstiella sp.]